MKLTLSNTLRTSARNSMLLVPPSGIFFVRPMSKRVNHGVRSRHRSVRTVAGLELDAVGAVGRREVAALRRAEIAVATRVRRADAERPPRVQNHVVGEREDDCQAGVRIRPSFPSVELLRLRSFVMPTRRTLPKFVVRCWKRPAPLNCQPPTIAFSTPGRLRPKRSLRPTGTRPVPLRLDGVADAGVGRARGAAEVEAEELRAFFERVLVAAVERQPVRQPPPQLDLQRVIGAECAAVAHVDLVGVRIDDEEVGRAGRRRGRCCGTSGCCRGRRRALALRVGRAVDGGGC